MAYERFKEGAEIDDYTKDLFEILKEIAKTAEINSKKYFIGGGIAIEVFKGKIARNHHDIDFHPLLKDYTWWKDWFVKKGYTIEEPASDDFEETCHVKDINDEDIIDMWPFKVENDICLIKHNGKYTNGNRHWNEIQTVAFDSVNITIENPQRVLEQKLRTAKKAELLRPQDNHDFKIMGVDPKLAS